MISLYSPQKSSFCLESTIYFSFLLLLALHLQIHQTENNLQILTAEEILATMERIDNRYFLQVDHLF